MRTVLGIVMICVCCFGVSSGIAKTESNFAAGFIIGEPTGLSLKLTNTIALGVSWSLRHDYVFISCDKWLVNRKLEDPISWYFGLGGAIGSRNDILLGLRVPVGLQFYFLDHFELFGEIVPGIALLPDPDPDVQGGIGLRYHF